MVFYMFNAAVLLAASGTLGWPSHCRFSTINWPTVSGLLNDFLHAKPEEVELQPSQHPFAKFLFDPFGGTPELSNLSDKFHILIYLIIFFLRSALDRSCPSAMFKNQVISLQENSLISV